MLDLAAAVRDNSRLGRFFVFFFLTLSYTRLLLLLFSNLNEKDVILHDRL